MSQTLYDKIWKEHVVHQQDDGTILLYVDRHLIHEVTSPQAFEGLRLSKRKVRKPNLTLAVADHNVPTTNRSKGIDDQESKIQVETLERNCKEFDIKLFNMEDKTQTLIQKKSKNFRVNVTGRLPIGVTPKDVILQTIGKIGTAGGTGMVIEYAGSVIENLNIEQRMTICNMSIEAGARAGLVAPDEKTIEYLKNKPMSPKKNNWEMAIEYWSKLKTDLGAKFDQEVEIKGDDISPMVTWGTSPQDVISIAGTIHDPEKEKNEDKKNSMKRSLNYMGLNPNTKITDVKIDRIFIGSCTNGRIGDLREAAKIIKGKKIAQHVNAMVVPGSGLVKQQAEEEGIDKIFKQAGFEWREPGCSMCLAMNADKLNPKERCASTSNRNFEGRQGRGGRTHLVSPAMAAAAAIEGHLTDVRKFQN